jgi:antitoxin HigA-1
MGDVKRDEMAKSECGVGNELTDGRLSLPIIRMPTALRLAKYFDMSPQFWLGLQMDYDLDVAEDELAGRIDDEVRVYSAV